MVITLTMLALITGILLAFFIQSMLSRQVSFSSAGHYRADNLAQTAIDTIVGDLRNEIVAGSSAFTTGTNTLYIPASNLTAVPCREADQGFQNLVKQSSALKPFWSGGDYGIGVTPPIRAASDNNTQTKSANGRYIKPNQWNRPGLLGDPGSGVTPALPGSYQPPDWIILTRQGAISNAAAMPSVSVLANKSGSNSSYAVGRFAYAIYDEGALLDINNAGYPSTLGDSSFTKERGLLPQVGIENLAGVLDSNSIVQWRNSTTAATAVSYTNAVLTATNGFTTVLQGDQAFITRKDLIHYIQDNSSQLQTSALPYLATFTRDTDGPSFYPDPNRAKVNSTQDDITNPNVLKIRVQTSFPRPDGTTAQPGDPLLKHRFPLSRLALFKDPTGNSALLKTYFAMQQRSDGQWDYVDPDTGAVATTLPTLKTLDQISGREPTFWELLQAGILTGSLGTSGIKNTYVISTQDANTTRQILTIGLCLIDQYDEDDTPTFLKLGGTQPNNINDLSVAGVENLPYMMWIAQEHFRDNISTLSPSTNAWIDGYLMFALWNPHRNASAANPGQFRIRVTGTSSILVYNSAMALGNQTSANVIHNNTALMFQTTASRNFSQISGLLPTDAILESTSPMAQFPYPPVSGVSALEVGILTGQVALPKTPEFPSSGNYIINYPSLTMVLEKQSGANWIPYQIISNYTCNYNNNGTSFANVSTALNRPNGFTVALIGLSYADPRTTRFGLAIGGVGVASNMMANNFNIINNSTGLPFSFKITGGSYFNLADYAYNTSATSNYADPDGTTRKADSNPLTTANHSHSNSPFYINSSDGRPIVLNRPFRSVAEMGYAFRDDPWRTLNFSSQDSADQGLLDLFCLNENTQELRAGVVNLNSASQNVLAAILVNAYRDPSSTDETPLSTTDAATIAQAIRTQLGSPSAPSLVIKNAADLPLLANKIASSLPDRFKFKREAFTRSFADIVNGRTWNFLVDIIAQSGRYRTSAPSSLNDFMVEGEQRYWLHIAIDRYTGKVIAQLLEPIQN
ncbi:MAG: hypothetical protein ACFUZC_11970 [Chthoniobacteraceae bacterium]